MTALVPAVPATVFMNRRHLVLLFLMIIGVIAGHAPVMAQPEMAAAFRPPLEIQQVQVQRADDGAVLVLVEGNPTHDTRQPLPTEGCAAPPGAEVDHTLNRDDTLLTLHIYSIVPVGDPACPGFAPFMTTIDLGSDFAPMTRYTLHINDTIVQFTPDDLSAEAQPSTLQMPVDSLVSDVTATRSDENTLVLTISGEHPDGCDVPLMTGTYRDFIQDDLLHIELFRALPPDVMCPAMLLMYSQEITTDLNADEMQIIDINGQYYRYQPDDDTLTPVLQEILQIETVERTATDDETAITVEGFYAGQCDSAITQDAAMVENDVVYVMVVRYVSQDSPCSRDRLAYATRLIVAEARATAPVVINGQHYQQPPDSRPADPADTESQQRIPAVIDTVEARILESNPPQLELMIRGYHPHGCAAETQSEQQVSDNSVIVRIFRDLPADTICPVGETMPIDETIRIEGTFTPGESITVQVNGFRQTVDF